MPDIITPAANPQLRLDGLDTPEPNTLASAGEMRAILQQLFDNDAALANLIAAKPVRAVVTQFNPNLGNARQLVDVPGSFMPSVGMVLGVQAGAGRVTGYGGGGFPDDPARPLYTPPPSFTRPVFDAGTGENGGLVIFDRPLNYGNPIGPGEVPFRLAYTPWHNAQDMPSFAVTMYVLPLGTWLSDAIAT